MGEEYADYNCEGIRRGSRPRKTWSEVADLITAQERCCGPLLMEKSIYGYYIIIHTKRDRVNE